eukprot:189909-Prymnesium_polylepis.1
MRDPTTLINESFCIPYPSRLRAQPGTVLCKAVLQLKPEPTTVPPTGNVRSTPSHHTTGYRVPPLVA